MPETICRISLDSRPDEEYYCLADDSLSLARLRGVVTAQFSLEDSSFQLMADRKEVSLPEQLTALLTSSHSMVHLRVVLPEVESTAAAQLESKLVAGVKVSGFKDCNSHWNCVWKRHATDFNGHPAFHQPPVFGRPLHLYYREESKSWVIDDVIQPSGPLFAQGEQLSGNWRVQGNWEVNDKIKVVFQRSQAVFVSGFEDGQQEDGTYYRVAGHINGQAHYVLSKDEPHERHLFADKYGWKICPKASEDAGSFAISASRQLEGQWKTISCTTTEQPTFQMLTAGQMSAETERQEPASFSTGIRCRRCRGSLQAAHYECISCPWYRLCSDCEELNAERHFHDEGHLFAKLRSLADGHCLRGVSRRTDSSPVGSAWGAQRARESTQGFRSSGDPMRQFRELLPRQRERLSSENSPSLQDLAKSVASLERRLDACSWTESLIPSIQI